MRIDQWVPALHHGDAIGDSARLMRDAFRRWGHRADVYALELDADLQGDGLPWPPPAATAADTVILHYALPSPLTGALASHPGRRVLIHHNITPPEFFAEWDPEMARICALGRSELAGLRDVVQLGLGDSEYNRRELEEAGFAATGVLPIFLDFDRYREPPDPVFARMLGDGRKNVLFVGRVAPNKRHDQIIRLAACWKRFISPDLRLVLVGKSPRTPGYANALRSLLYELGFTSAEVLFTGHVTHAELLACYASAHVFVSMSEHEGFGVPLVEAMLMDVPILARRCTAVPHTLGDAGVQFVDAPLDELAEVAHRLATDRVLRDGVLAGQRRRLAAFAPAAVEGALRRFIAP